MRIAGETVGARGAALLSVTALVGLFLAAHGWQGRHHGLPPAGLGVTKPSVSAPATPGASSPAPTGSGQPSQTPSASAAPRQGPAAAAAPTPGPKLSSQSYASYSFLVWPGTPSSAAQAAETGLTIGVHRQGTGISVAAGVAGQGAPTARYYPTGTKVYVIEASMGDDSGNSDFNLGDDGLIVTDSQGRILQ
ncbi:MAG TPA: hypothetical protein VN840_21085 [Streptosporangiaceae bacterium]|nr:hypothetical protein [Streptosporangiaceae bacterium]